MKNKSTNNTRPKNNHRGASSLDIMLRIIFLLLAVLTCAVASYFIYSSYQDHTNPKQIYGEWIEVNAPKYQTDILSFSNKGVTFNHRLISTKFDYDGNKIYIKTSSSETIYEIVGTSSSPQLLRVLPETPKVMFIKKGYEHTIENNQNSVIKSRGQALSEHFN